MSGIGKAIKTMKWYEWFILAESVAFLSLVQFTAKYPSAFGFWGGVVLMLIVGYVNSFLPVLFARKSRARGNDGIARFMIVMTCLGLGVAGLLVYGISRLPSAPSGSSLSAIKTCSRCNRVVSLAAKAGDSCPYCGARWSFEKTSYPMNR